MSSLGPMFTHLCFNVPGVVKIFGDKRPRPRSKRGQDIHIRFYILELDEEKVAVFCVTSSISRKVINISCQDIVGKLREEIGMLSDRFQKSSSCSFCASFGPHCPYCYDRLPDLVPILEELDRGEYLNAIHTFLSRRSIQAVLNWKKRRHSSFCHSIKRKN